MPRPILPNGTSTTNTVTMPVVVDENIVVRDYVPPGTIPSSNKDKNNTDSDGGNHQFASKKVQWVYNPADGSILEDHNGLPVSVDRLLATTPLRHELSTRPGPGNKKLTYLSGEGVSRTLNDVFGFDGWDLDIQHVSREACTKDSKTGKHTVVYTARVRLKHKASGAYKEDCGAGDSTDRNFGTAISHALKASITDAMKRAARHFGDKLGNSLYHGNFSINKAPVALKDALDKYDIHRSTTKFGFQKNNKCTATTTTTNTVVNAPAATGTSVASKQHTSALSMTTHPKSSCSPPPSAPENVRHDKNNVANKYQHQNQRQQSATTNSNALKRTSSLNNHHYQQQQQQNVQPQGQSTSTNENHLNRTGSLSNNRQQQQPKNKLLQQQNPSIKGNTLNRSGSINNHDHQQMTMNPTVQSNMGITQQSHAGSVMASTANVGSTLVRPTSSYGQQRPSVGSNNTGNNSTVRGSTSSNLVSVGTAPSTTAGPLSNNNYHNNSTSNNSRRVSHEPHPQQQQQQQHQRQSIQPQYSNTGNNAQMVSQTPSAVIGNNTNNNVHKRPPLGSIPHNSTSDSSKRTKQHHHHNPYNQSYGGGYKNGRKSI
mmetsp:Transcript_61816/g.69226  ORF Transcript_61816/g.69226 Transcript_61816/m.69226 type:complete len:598 (-) Transcript_61816:165-1958(-)